MGHEFLFLVGRSSPAFDGRGDLSGDAHLPDTQMIPLRGRQIVDELVLVGQELIFDRLFPIGHRRGILRLGFLDGVAWLVHIAIGCCNSFHKYAKLMAMQRERK